MKEIETGIKMERKNLPVNFMIFLNDERRISFESALKHVFFVSGNVGVTVIFCLD